MHAPSPLLISLTLYGLAVLALAFWRGGAAERLAAAILAVNLAAVWVVIFALTGGSNQMLGLLVQLTFDGAAALGLLYVVLRYGRPWLGIAMLLSAAQFALQSVYLVADLKKDYWHVLLNNLNFIAIHLSLLAGTLQHWMRRAKAARRQAAAQ